METNDCVSREKVAYMITNGKYTNENYEQFIDRLVKELWDLPSVIPYIKKGYWIGRGANGFYGECSECGQSIQVNAWYANNMKYCPNCGAKMKTKSESEE